MENQSSNIQTTTSLLPFNAGSVSQVRWLGMPQGASRPKGPADQSLNSGVD